MTARLSVTGIASEVATGRRTAVNVAGDVIARLEAYDAVQPQAWISRSSPEDLLAQAAAIDARVAAGQDLPLAGVPFAVKDNIDAMGFDTTAGCPAFAYRPQANATVVEKALQAGALLVGKTNLDQFATGLNGTRSPYGAPRCVYNGDYISGGSSSGSAVGVAAGLVAFAFGTDTAGSGRVPAAINHLVGFKPTKGRWSTSGLVPACRTLDCITVFTAAVDEALLVDTVVAGFDAKDDYSRPLTDLAGPVRTLGIARPDQLDWCGDAESEALYRASVDRFRALGCAFREIDLAPLSAAAALLYNGPWVAERTAAVADFLQANAGDFDPTVRVIIEGGLRVTGVEAFAGQYRLAGYKRIADSMWGDIDALLLPTAPTVYTVAAMRADPVRLNAKLGLYTNFVNLLDMAAVAVPAGFRGNATGFGVTLVGPAWSDRPLADLASTYTARLELTPPALDLLKREP
jgi:allophanate hydrolase